MPTDLPLPHAGSMRVQTPLTGLPHADPDLQSSIPLSLPSQRLSIAMMDMHPPA